MHQILESSVVVRAFRWFAQDSVVATAVKSVHRMFARVDEAFARAAAEKEAQVDEARLASVLRNSTIVRAVDAVFSAPFAAWEHARVRPLVDDARTAVAEMSPAQRIRLLGWMIAVALITRALLYVASGASLTRTTLGVWGLVLTVALVMMIASRQIAAGWHEWKGRKR